MKVLLQRGRDAYVADSRTPRSRAGRRSARFNGAATRTSRIVYLVPVVAKFDARLQRGRDAYVADRTVSPDQRQANVLLQRGRDAYVADRHHRERARGRVLVASTGPRRVRRG